MPETEEAHPSFLNKMFLGNSFDRDVDETAHEDAEEGAKNIMTRDPDFGEGQRNHVNLNDDKKDRGNEEEKDHEEKGEGVKKHGSPL
jgi:hypothetical protein